MKRIIRKVKKEKAPSFNKNLFFLIITLLVLGLVFIADISAPQALNDFNDKFYFFKSQLGAAGVGLVLMFIASKIHFSFWRKVANLGFIVSLLLLVLVLIPEFGLKIYGARRWISIMGFNFQPSEILKFTLVLYMANLTVAKKKPLAFFIPIGLSALLIMLQPDLGSTLVVASIGMAQIWVSGISILSIIYAGVIAIISAGMLIMVSPYRRERLMTFLSVTSDPLGKEYHIRQILIAIGSGGLFGLGVGHSKQKFLFLPETATDSVFAAIAEEIGFFGSTIIILLFFYFVFLALKIAQRSEDVFAQSTAVGIAAWIGVQTFLNLASMLALTPLTGIPLPFFSHGGTSLVMILVACGILLNISRYNVRR